MTTNYGQSMLLYVDVTMDNAPRVLKLKDHPEWRTGQKKSQLFTEDSDREVDADKNCQSLLALDGERDRTPLCATSVQLPNNLQRVDVIDIDGHKFLRQFEGSNADQSSGKSARVRQLGFIPGRKRLLASFEGAPGLVFLKCDGDNYSTNLDQNERLPHKAAVLGWDLSPDGQILVSLDASNTLSFWDPRTDPPKLLVAIPDRLTPNTTCVAHGRGNGPEDRIIATGDHDGNVTVWHYSMSQEQPPRITLGNPKPLKQIGPVRKVLFSADGRVLAALAGQGNEGRIRLWPTKGLVPAGP